MYHITRRASKGGLFACERCCVYIIGLRAVLLVHRCGRKYNVL